MTVFKCLIAIVAAALAGIAVWHLETARRGVTIAPLDAGGTPASAYRLPENQGPIVIITHGFAGSRQLMEAFALTLARAGYTAVSFDFQGHGRNPAPMSGDLTRIEGTTQHLIAETAAVIDAAQRAFG